MNRNKGRIGVSTGSCAAAAAKAALLALAGGAPREVDIPLPSGQRLALTVRKSLLCQDEAIAEVIKDAGSDPDVTHGALIRARVSYSFEASSREVLLYGGQGVGRVTQPGLELPVGETAINPEPRAQIRRAVREAMPEGETPGVRVVIEVDQGQELARKTMNPRLGIVEGISILGTRGTVLPYSAESYRETIRMGLDVARARGLREAALSTGGRSERLVSGYLPNLPGYGYIQIADFFAFSLELAAARGFYTVYLSLFFGKLVKMAQGFAYTHAGSSRTDFDLLAQWCRKHGADQELARAIGRANTGRHALEMLKQSSVLQPCLQGICSRARERALGFSGGKLEVLCFLFDFDGELLYTQTEP